MWKELILSVFQRVFRLFNVKKNDFYQNMKIFIFSIFEVIIFVHVSGALGVELFFSREKKRSKSLLEEKFSGQGSIRGSNVPILWQRFFFMPKPTRLLYIYILGVSPWSLRSPTPFVKARNVNGYKFLKCVILKIHTDDGKYQNFFIVYLTQVYSFTNVNFIKSSKWCVFWLEFTRNYM